MHDSATSLERLTAPYPACAAEGGNRSGQPSASGFGTWFPRQDRGRPATRHGLAVTNTRITP